MQYRNNIVASSAAVAMILASGATAQAQDFTLDPSYGTIELSAGFNPDPYTTDLMAGGSEAASNINSTCRGYISNAPDISLKYDNGSGILPLIIMVESQADTTLVVNSPSGSWYCDDDTGAGVNPLMRFEEPESGRYDIWVGTYSDPGLQSATLMISELDSTINDASTSYDVTPTLPDPTLPAAFGSVDLTAGFTPDPYEVAIVSGGSIEANSVDSSCRGYVAEAPDFSVTYSSGSLPLILSASASADTTLLVNDPNGNWHCDDDSGDGVNPSLRFEKPLSGRYDIWIGTYSSGEQDNSATLHISELYSQ